MDPTSTAHSADGSPKPPPKALSYLADSRNKRPWAGPMPFIAYADEIATSSKLARNVLRSDIKCGAQKDRTNNERNNPFAGWANGDVKKPGHRADTTGSGIGQLRLDGMQNTQKGQQHQQQRKQQLLDKPRRIDPDEKRPQPQEQHHHQQQQSVHKHHTQRQQQQQQKQQQQPQRHHHPSSPLRIIRPHSPTVNVRPGKVRKAHQPQSDPDAHARLIKARKETVHSNADSTAGVNKHNSNTNKLNNLKTKVGTVHNGKKKVSAKNGNAKTRKRLRKAMATLKRERIIKPKSGVISTSKSADNKVAVQPAVKDNIQHPPAPLKNGLGGQQTLREHSEALINGCSKSANSRDQLTQKPLLKGSTVPDKPKTEQAPLLNPKTMAKPPAPPLHSALGQKAQLARRKSDPAVPVAGGDKNTSTNGRLVPSDGSKPDDPRIGAPAATTKETTTTSTTKPSATTLSKPVGTVDMDKSKLWEVLRETVKRALETTSQ